MSIKLIISLSIVVGLLLLVIAFVYLTTPVAGLPHFFPGFDPAVTKIHFKHGLASLILAIGSFVFAWFQSGKLKTK